MLSRGGEYALAARLLDDLVIADLSAGLGADALLRARQAAGLAASTGDPVAFVRHTLVLGVALAMSSSIDTVRAAEVARIELPRIASPIDRIHLTALVDLVAGIGARLTGHLAAARDALHAARTGAIAAGRPDLAGTALAHLGLVELGAGAADAAVTCFWFARDFHRLAARRREAVRAAALAVIVLAAQRRWDQVIALSPALRDDADAAGDPALAARMAAIAADAALAAGPGAAGTSELVRDAATRAAALDDAIGDRRELLVRARLRLARTASEPLEQLRHLEAAFDLGLVAGAAPLLAEALDEAVSAALRGGLPAGGWDLIARLIDGLRSLGRHELADVAATALSELRARE